MVGTPLSVVLRRDSRPAACPEPGAKGLALARLHHLPPFDDLLGRDGRVVGRASEDVRMPADELVADGADRVGNGEVAGLFADLREKHRFVEIVAELLAKVVHVAALDRLEDFVGFFEHERPQRAERLLSVPGTSARRAQCSHDLDKAVELGPGVRIRADARAMGERRVSHGVSGAYATIRICSSW